LVFPQQWEGEDGSVAQAQRICAALGKLITRGSEVEHVDRLAIDNGPPVSPGSAESPSDDVLRDRPGMSPENQRFVLAQEYPRVVRIAQPADLTSVSSTALRSKVERLITLSTSAVAVCCSRASFSSRVSRATSVSWPEAEELLWRPTLRVFALRLRALAS